MNTRACVVPSLHAGRKLMPVRNVRISKQPNKPCTVQSNRKSYRLERLTGPPVASRWRAVVPGDALPSGPPACGPLLSRHRMIRMRIAVHATRLWSGRGPDVQYSPRLGKAKSEMRESAVERGGPTPGKSGALRAHSTVIIRVPSLPNECYAFC